MAKTSDRPEEGLSSRPEESDGPNSPEETDYVLEYLKENSIPITRETYLEVAYFGDPPDLGPELESMLPEELRIDDPDENSADTSDDVTLQ
jgi:hypothetical protein